MGNLTPATFLSLRSTLSRVLRTVYGDEWRDVSLRETDENDLYRKYVIRTTGKYNSRYLIVTKSRLRRVFRLLGNDGNDTIKKPAKVFDPTLAFVQSIENSQAFFMSQYGQKIFGPSRSPNYNYYVLPITSEKNAGIILPKGLADADLEPIERLVNSILLYEHYRQKGGRATHGRSQDQNN